MKSLAAIILGTLGTMAAAQTLPVVEYPTTAPAVAQTTQPTTHPTTQASTQPAVAPKKVVSKITGKELTPPPTEFDVLSTRTVFIKSRVAPPPPVPATQPTTAVVSPTARAEAAMVFNGVTEIDGVGFAIFEDTLAGKINGYKVGDPIASGKITGIRLDGLDYESNGKTIHISIGQTLEGGEAPDLMSRAVVTGSTGTTTQPSSGNPTDDAVLRALRERRRRELGQ